METQVRLHCAQCGKVVLRPKKEYDRQVRKGRDKFFCTHSCHYNFYGLSNPNPQNLHANNRRDGFTPFRWFLLRVRYRAGSKNQLREPSDLTLDYLKDLWSKQGGACPFTGWLLNLPLSTAGSWEDPGSPRNASLDRIDDTKGYVQGNVRFVCVMANYARNTYSDQDLIGFCRDVSKHCGAVAPT